ncbi:MAG: DUF4336 domain-containing protein [Pseudomonadota bacterium]
MLIPFEDEIWTADGPVVLGAAGFSFPTRMVVIRLPGRQLFVHSPVALTDELMSAVQALGRVAYLVAPNNLHFMFLDSWARAFPAAQVFGAPGVDRKCPGLDIMDLGRANWGGALDQVVFPGNRITTEYVFHHRLSRTVVFTDLIQQLPKGWYKGWRRVVANLDLMTGSEPAVPRKFRVAFQDRAAARTAAETVLRWKPRHLSMAHGPLVKDRGAETVEAAFRWSRP